MTVEPDVLFERNATDTTTLRDESHVELRTSVAGIVAVGVTTTDGVLLSRPDPEVF